MVNQCYLRDPTEKSVQCNSQSQCYVIVLVHTAPPAGHAYCRCSSGPNADSQAGCLYVVSVYLSLSDVGPHRDTNA